MSLLRSLTIQLTLVSLLAAVQAFGATEPRLETTLDLEWETVEEAASYELRLTPIDGGQPILLQSRTNKISQSVPVGTYRLQIRSKDKQTGYFGEWSEPTEIEAMAKIVEPLEPANEQVISEIKEKKAEAVFKWAPAAGAKRYTLRIWSGDSKKAFEFATLTTSKRLFLPTSRTYFWHVTFEDVNSIRYRAEPKTVSFTILGSQLAMPVISTEAPFAKATWTKSPGATHYTFKLLRRYLDGTEWSTLTGPADLKTTQAALKDIKPGAYRIEVIAHGPSRVSSELAFYEFVAKPTEEELARALSSSGIR